MGSDYARTAAIVARGAASAHRSTALEDEVVALFDQMRVRVLRYVVGMGLPAAEAEEIVQDVFLALYQHLRSGKPRTSIRGWVFRVAHNLSLKRRQAALRMQVDPISAAAGRECIQIADPAPNPEDELARRQRQTRLQSVLGALPETDRQCLCLRAEGLRYREIAEVLEISLGSVANAVARSLARMSKVAER